MNPAKIIIDSVKDRLEQFDENYVELLMSFKINSTDCEAVLIDEENNREKFPLEEGEVSKLKTLFLNKIAKAYSKMTGDKRQVEKIILKIDLENEAFKLFVGVVDSDELFQLY